ncbi:ATP-binding protein [Balneolaceae bacterium ANBcel3]|nr:ATP-binding protein [Balneolaceae bacterium ANBcel3]
MKKTFSIPAEPDSLEVIRGHIDSVAEDAGLDKKKAYKLKLAVDEIAANIINYGFQATDSVKEPIEITMELLEQHLSVTLEDHAIPFNPLEKAIPGEEDLKKEPEDRPIGGLGIMLARSNVDDFSYEFSKGKNINKLTIHI